MRAIVATLIAAGVAGCGEPTAGERVVKSAAPSPCDLAARERGRLTKLLEEGRVDRAARVLARADELCARRPDDGAEELRARVREALDAHGRSADDLIAAGLAARARPAESRRLLGQALVALEKSAGSAAELDVWPGLSSRGDPAWSQARRLFAVPTWQGVSLYDARGRLVDWVTTPPSAARFVAWSEDGATLATAGREGEVRLWDAGTWTLRRSFRLPGRARGVALAGGMVLAAAESSVRRWDAATGKDLGDLEGFAFPDDDGSYAGSQLLVSPDGRLLGGRGAAGDYRVVDRVTGARVARDRVRDERDVVATREEREGAPLVREAHGYRWPDAHALFGGARGVAATSDDEGWVCSWDVATGAVRREVTARLSGQWIGFTDEGATLLSWAWIRPVIERWDIGTGAPSPRGPIAVPKGSMVNRVSLAGDGRLLSIVTIEETTLVDLTGATADRTLRPKEVMLGVAITADAVVGWSEGATVSVWDRATGALRGEVRGPRESIFAAAPSPDGSLVALLGHERCWAHVFEVGTRSFGKAFRVAPDEEIEPPLAFGFCGDGARVALLHTGEPLRAWEAATGVATSAEGCSLGPEQHAIPFAGGGELVLGTASEATAFFRTTDGSEVLRILRPAEVGARIVLTPNGHADVVGRGARALVRCRVGAKSYPLEVCEERLVVAGLHARAMAGDASYLLP